MILVVPAVLAGMEVYGSPIPMAEMARRSAGGRGR